MKYALFVTEQSQSATGSTPGQWSMFLATTKAIEEHCEPTSLTEIGQGVFLLNLANGALALSLLVKHAADHGFRSRVLLFDHEPSFVTTDPPKT